MCGDELGIYSDTHSSRGYRKEAKYAGQQKNKKKRKIRNDSRKNPYCRLKHVAEVVERC